MHAAWSPKRQRRASVLDSIGHVPHEDCFQKKSTLPSTRVSKTTLPSRAQNCLRTLSFVASLEVVTARCISPPGMYSSMVLTLFCKAKLEREWAQDYRERLAITT